MINRYVQHGRIFEKKFRPLVQPFFLDLDAVQISQLSPLNCYLAAMRTRMVEFCELESPLKGEIEIDDIYYLGAKRVKGKRQNRYKW